MLQEGPLVHFARRHLVGYVYLYASKPQQDFVRHCSDCRLWHTLCVVSHAKETLLAKLLQALQGLLPELHKAEVVVGLVEVVLQNKKEPLNPEKRCVIPNNNHSCVLGAEHGSECYHRGCIP